MKKGLLILAALLLFSGCGKEKSSETIADIPTEAGQFEGDSAIISEDEAMLLFEEIYEINKYLEDGREMRFDGNTVEIDGALCICAVMGMVVDGEFVQEAYYAATWGSAYWYDPEGDAWLAVGFG